MALQLEEGDDAAAEGDCADDGGAERYGHDEGERGVRRLSGELDGGDSGRLHHPLHKQSDHLRHGGHLHAIGTGGSDDEAKADACGHEHPFQHAEVLTVQVRQHGGEREQHAACGDEVALARGLG